jgi:putative endonuclease
MTACRRTPRWRVYIVSCSDGTLYTGITTDLERRIGEHNSEKGGARYTRSRQPVKLAYWESAENRSEAARREYRIRRMPSVEKKKLVVKGKRLKRKKKTATP